MQEGIKWTQIQYFNNKVVCDLIENKLVSGVPSAGEAFLGSRGIQGQGLGGLLRWQKLPSSRESQTGLG